VVGPAAEELGAVYGCERIFTGGFESLELGAVGSEVGAEGLNTLCSLVCFRRVELVLGEVGVLVYGAREGG
jgi:hypothetical protein